MHVRLQKLILSSLAVGVLISAVTACHPPQGVGLRNECTADFVAASFSVQDPAKGTVFEVGTLEYNVNVLGDLGLSGPKVISNRDLFALPLTEQQKYVQIIGQVRYPASAPGERTPVALSNQPCSRMDGAMNPCFPIVFYVAADGGSPSEIDHALDTLVRKGFVTVAFGVTAVVPHYGTGVEERIRRLSAHLAFWSMASGRVFDVERVANVSYALFSRTNLYRIGLMGMSQGGEAVLVTYLRMRDLYDLAVATGGIYNRIERWQIRGIFALAPMTQLPETQQRPIGLDKPYMVMMGSNDLADQVTGLRTYDRIDSSAVKYQAYVDGPGHSWNEGPPPFDDFAATARTVIAAFFQRYVAGVQQPEQAVLGGLRQTESTRRTAIAWSYQVPGSWMVDDFGQPVTGFPYDDLSWNRQNNMGGQNTVEPGAADITVVRRYFYTTNLSPGATNTLFHDAIGAEIHWSHPGGVVRFDMGGSRNISDFDLLSIRAAKVFFGRADGSTGDKNDRATDVALIQDQPPFPTGNISKPPPLQFGLGLKDDNGAEVVIPVQVREPFVPTAHVVHKTVLETIWIPLTCFADRGIDLRQVREVVLSFDASEAGTVAVDDIQFTWRP